MHMIEAIEIFVKDHNNWSPETKATYRYALRDLATTCQREIEKITPEQIQAWVDLRSQESEEMEKRKKWSNNTQCLKASAARTFFSYWCDEEILEVNPALRLKTGKLEEADIKPMDELEVFQLIEAARGHKRDLAILELLCCSGIRVSELINVRLVDINLDLENIDIVNGKGLKERTIFFTFKCKSRLKAYLATRSDDCLFLFATRRNKHISRQGIQKIFRKYVEKAGLREDITIHTCRHTVGFRLAESGFTVKEIADILGHKDYETARKYVKFSKKKLQELYDLYH